MAGGRLRSRCSRPRYATIGLLCGLCIGPAAAEPLMLRVRVRAEAGSIEGARAAREAVWARSQVRARAVIASVCTGCLGAWQNAAGPVPAAYDRPAAAWPEAAPRPEPAGLDVAPASGASEPDSEPPSEPPIRERRP